MDNKKIYYFCSTCGNVMEMIAGGKVCPHCCGRPMDVLDGNTHDGAQEKHLPLVKVAGSRVEVCTGEVEHPMGDDHYIGWISVLTDRGMHRKNLKTGTAPSAVFLLEDETPVEVYSWCNLHGLWKVVL